MLAARNKRRDFTKLSDNTNGDMGGNTVCLETKIKYTHSIATLLIYCFVDLHSLIHTVLALGKTIQHRHFQEYYKEKREYADSVVFLKKKEDTSLIKVCFWQK